MSSCTFDALGHGVLAAQYSTEMLKVLVAEENFGLVTVEDES